jgi:hypothetical protein
MRIQLAAAILLSAIGDSGMYAAEKTRVDVYISDRDNSSVLLRPGKVLASALFDRAGVRIAWHAGEPGSIRRDSSHAAIVIRTVEYAPPSAAPGALASARLGESAATEITVYENRVQRFLFDHPSLAAVGVGYVLAHELGHAIQGVARHSQSGIMKAQWSREDFQQMVLHKLAFTDFDVALIHRGLTGQPTADPNEEKNSKLLL